MEIYTALRAFADTWGLLLMFVVFVGVVVWVMRPGARKAHDDASKLIFRNEDRPKADKNDDRDDRDGR